VQTRRETDWLGEAELPAGTLYGIHTYRALRNFALAGRPVNPALIHAYGAVKLACAETNHELGCWDETVYAAITAACREMLAGRLDSHVKVDALQGGAGTSTNMNVNEVLANRALQLLGRAPGDYAVIHPIEDLNRHQSTNDTYPTALRVAAIGLLRGLEPALVRLIEACQRQEKALERIVKVGRTETQDAVLTTLGRTMAAFAEAFARDRWRVYKCEERLRVVNLGGTAIGTGLTAPRPYIFRVTERLAAITGIGLARAENLIEATQNADALVEVSGILKTLAANLVKVCGDLRFMASGPDAGIGELHLAPRQAGSSLMPGKVNPVIPEAVTQAALAVMANDLAVTQAGAAGHLELNPFLPLVADALLGSLDLLTRSVALLAECVDELRADAEACRRHVENSTAIVTALAAALGYQQAEALAREARESGRTIRALVREHGLMSDAEFERLTSAESVLRLGGAPGGGA